MGAVNDMAAPSYLEGKCTMKSKQTRANIEETDDPSPRLRLPLATAQDVRRELARLYREGKAGYRDVGDVSKLANVLATLGRLIETGDLETRIERLEAEHGKP